jgi:uncharacterized protein YaiI (UPF0178 family)
MQIWVDADACPKPVKEILYRAAERTEVQLVLVANRPLRTPRSRFVRSVRVPTGFDVADGRILDQVQRGDLVITADIPLAAEVIGKGASALDPRGRLYTEENVRECLAVRDLKDELRSIGVDTGGPPALSKSDRREFANQLDRILAARTG